MPAQPYQITRHRVGLFLAPLVFGAVWLAPLGLDVRAHRLAAIFGAVVVLWLSEAVPISVTALLIAPAMVAMGVTTSKEAFAPYADPLIFLFIGGFFIAHAMMRHTLDRRVAYAIMNLGMVKRSATRLRIAFMLAALALSMWISNTATSAMLIPILLGTRGKSNKPLGAGAIDSAAGDGASERVGSDRREGEPHEDQTAGSVLAIAYACSLGGMASLIGSPPNVITARFIKEAGIEFDFAQWMAIGLPAALVLLLASGVVLQRLAPPPPPVALPERHHKAWSRGERVTALAFGLAVAGWILPGVFKAMQMPFGAELAAALPAGAVAILASSVLFAFHDERGERVLPWSEATKIDWGLILLFGGGISLGTQMFETGLAEALSVWFLDLTGVSSLWGLCVALIALTILFTEVCSNTASANMIVPLAIAAALKLQVSPVAPALAVGLAASCAFMLPIATGPNAIAYGTGIVTLPRMMRTGWWLNVVCGVCLFAALRVLCPLLGW